MDIRIFIKQEKVDIVFENIYSGIKQYLIAWYLVFILQQFVEQTQFEMALQQ